MVNTDVTKDIQRWYIAYGTFYKYRHSSRKELLSVMESLKK